MHDLVRISIMLIDCYLEIFKDSERISQAMKTLNRKTVHTSRSKEMLGALNKLLRATKEICHGSGL